MYKLPLIESPPTNGGPPFYFAKAGIHVVVCLAKAFRHIRESATKLSKVYATELELNLRQCVKEVARKRHEHQDTQESLAAIMQTLNMFAYQLRASAGRFPRTARSSEKFSIAVDRFYASLRAFKSELDYVGNLMQCYHDTAEKVESAVMYAFENATSTTIKKSNARRSETWASPERMNGGNCLCCRVQVVFSLVRQSRKPDD